MAQIVNLELLRREAAVYDPVLRTLPSVWLAPFISTMRFNLQEVKQEDRLINLRRQGAMLRPYTGTVERPEEGELLSVEESVLRAEPGYLCLVDNVMNYRDKALLMRGGETVDHKSKRHPHERLILENVVKTFVEDFTLAIPHASRNGTASPLGVFQGFNAVLDGLIAEEKVSKARGNLLECDPINAPKNGEDTKALDALIKWLRMLDPLLKAGDIDLILTQERLQNVLDAFENRRKNLGEISRQRLQEFLREKAMISGSLTLITHPILGNGDRMIACRPGTITVGISAPEDLQFVQVRSVYNDPNLVQFWLQAAMGTRIDDWHRKIFCTNGGSMHLQDLSLSGDYIQVSSGVDQG